MVDGFWTVQFQGVQGGGGGVAVFNKHKVQGGDSGYTYLGTYEESGNNVKAKIKVSNFSPGFPNVMGHQGDFELEFSGTVNGDVMNVTANLVGAPNMKLQAQLKRKAALP